LLHLLPALHAAHAAPPAPQTPSAVPSWQFPLPSQQPFRQLSASHAQAPLTHS
jgi:hypothetical protein